MTPSRPRPHWIHRALPHHEETNVVFFRGLSTDALTQGLLDQRRIPLAYGKGPGWSVILHDLFGWNSDDYSEADYGPLCAAGGELAVFVTEPCVAKAHGPWFSYYRDGRLITGFSFENLRDPWGEDPDLLRPSLTRARLIGPEAEPDRDDWDDHEERTVEAIADFFRLPQLEMPQVEVG